MIRDREILLQIKTINGNSGFPSIMLEKNFKEILKDEFRNDTQKLIVEIGKTEPKEELKINMLKEAIKNILDCEVMSLKYNDELGIFEETKLFTVRELIDLNNDLENQIQGLIDQIKARAKEV